MRKLKEVFESILVLMVTALICILVGTIFNLALLIIFGTIPIPSEIGFMVFPAFVVLYSGTTSFKLNRKYEKLSRLRTLGLKETYEIAFL